MYHTPKNHLKIGGFLLTKLFTKSNLHNIIILTLLLMERERKI